MLKVQIKEYKLLLLYAFNNKDEQFKKKKNRRKKFPTIKVILRYFAKAIKGTMQNNDNSEKCKQQQRSHMRWETTNCDLFRWGNRIEVATNNTQSTKCISNSIILTLEKKEKKRMQLIENLKMKRNVKKKKQQQQQQQAY